MPELFHLFLLLAFFIPCVWSVDEEANVHNCVKASRRLHYRTEYPPFIKPPHPDEKNPIDWMVQEPTAVMPCIVCEPTNELCPQGCQNLLNFFFKVCKGVCLPETYFFDPQMTMAGCWDDHKVELERHAQRCGCSAASAGVSPRALLIYVLVAIVSCALAMN